MTTILDTMIQDYAKEDDFFGEVSEKQVVKVEDILGLRFPSEYRNFLMKYGSGGICGIDLQGIEGNQRASVVSATERYRALGLRNDIVVVWDLGDFVYCMNTIDNDPCIYVWYRSNPNLVKKYESFTEFLTDMYQEAIDDESIGERHSIYLIFSAQADEPY